MDCARVNESSSKARTSCKPGHTLSRAIVTGRVRRSGREHRRGASASHGELDASVNISEPFIRRPIATSLLMAGVVLVGLLGYFLLPISALPPVDFPTIQVTAQYPGASPEVMASSVTTPL